MATHPQFSRLFQAGEIGQLQLKNRFVMPAMGTRYSTEEGYVTQRMKDYYAERAKGGAGLIIVENACVDAPVGKHLRHLLGIDNDRYIPGLRSLAEAIKKHGAKAAIQVNHGGHVARKVISGFQPVAPSAIARPSYEMPRELTIREIAEITKHYADAAVRAKKAGFDGVEIHGAHHYLIAQFLSSVWNARKDQYGGSLRNRARFLLDIIKTMKEATGPDFPVWCRLNGLEYGAERGFDIEECKEVARLAEAAGVDAVSISAWYLTPTYDQAFNLPFTAGNMIHLAAAVKDVVKVPIMTVGRIGPELAEATLAEGKADFIALGRALIADPHLPNKVAAGKVGDIIPCISCLECLASITSDQFLQGLHCQVNATAGKEREYQIRPARNPRTVLVVGGGPAGMEAARVSAFRGHSVLLYEANRALGGQLLQAIIPPHKERLKPLLDYQIAQLQKLGVKVELGKEVDVELVDAVRPDVIILATGVRPFIPEIPGLDEALKKSRAVTAQDVLASGISVGKRVVVIGGEMVGCEVASFLARLGKKVTLVRRGSRIATKVRPHSMRELLLKQLDESQVTILTGVRYEAVTDQGLVVSTRAGLKQTLQADTLVLATGATPDSRLLLALRGRPYKLYMAGDCILARNIREAIHEGYTIALSI